MVYDPTIPTSTEFISTSQPKLLENFSQLNVVFSENHVAFDDGTAVNRGKHTNIVMTEQAGDPATLLNEMAIYTKDLAGVNTQYLRKESNGTVIQLTGPDPVAAANGQTYLPGGIIMKWGVQALAADNQLFAFPTPFPNACFSVFITNRNSGNNISYYGAVLFDVNGFNVWHNGGTLPSNFSYLAIGN